MSVYCSRGSQRNYLCVCAALEAHRRIICVCAALEAHRGIFVCVLI